MRLALGTGSQTNAYKARGFITVDARKPADYIAVIPPLPDEIMKMGRVFTRVEASHFWEHLYHWQAVELAGQLAKIIQPGGILVLEMPRLDQAIDHFINGEKDPRLTMWAIYGAQTDPKWSGNIYQAHKWGYTPETISQQLMDAGFSEVEIKRATVRMPDIRDMRVEAYV